MSSRLFVHPTLGFSFEIPEHWTLASWQNRTALPAHEHAMQTAPDDLPAAGDLRTVLVAQEILEQEFGRIRCHLELCVWKDTPFTLPTRAKKFPCGELPFKARSGLYGRVYTVGADCTRRGNSSWAMVWFCIRR